jgi:transposase
MVTDAQVRLLRRKMSEGKTQEAASAAAGMSVRTARIWQEGPLPSQTKRARDWRTRVDPFAEVWDRDIEPLLAADARGVLDGTTLMAMLEERYPGRFAAGQLRSLQRRLRDWRAQQGPAKEVFFEQVHPPGREGACDFTHATELGVTIAGRLFEHLFFQLILSHSKWRFVCLAYSETFEALVAGLQGALWALGGVPQVLRSDNMSAATYELREGGRSLTERFAAVLAHYGMQSTRIMPGEAHQNGVAEKSHDVLKRTLAQALVIRGSSDFATIADYEQFVQEIVEHKLNRAAVERLSAERPLLLPLPSSKVPAYSTYETTVRKWSTIRVAKRTYSVPSRLIGHTLTARLYADKVEVLYRNKVVQTMERLRGDCDHRIDYRHVIWSLVRKPGAFARYRYREDLFPSLTFRRAYDVLAAHRGIRADIEYVRILHLAASTMESTVEAALRTLLDADASFEYADVQRLAAPHQAEHPVVHIAAPDLASYDDFLVGGAR